MLLLGVAALPAKEGLRTMDQTSVDRSAPRRTGNSLGFQSLNWVNLVDELPVGIAICDLDGCLVQYNEHAAALWGRTPPIGSPDHLIAKSLKSGRPEGEVLTEPPMAEVLRTGKPVRGRELLLDRPDGSRIFIQANLEPLFDDAGGIVGAVSCFQDVTASREAQRRATRDNDLLRAIVETTPECIKIVARDGTLMQMNSAGHEMVEASAGTPLEGSNVLDLVAPEFRETWKANHERVCGGERLSWEFDIIGLAGTRRHMETLAVPLLMPDGSLAQLAISRDVTRRKLNDRLLRDSEHRYKELLQALPAAIYTTDMDGRITFYNDAAVAFAGRQPALGEQWCVTWRLYHPDGTPMPHDQCPMAEVLREKRPVRNQEAIAERPDGSRLWFMPFPTPLTDSAGTMTGAINMLVDITARKEAERHHKLMVDELNHRVKNTLATVQSLVAQTARAVDSTDVFREKIEARLFAMSFAHDQLTRRGWNDADLLDLAKAGLAPYQDKGNIVVSGSPTTIAPRAAILLSMVFYELATNAIKFGALASPGGKVELGWTVTGDTTAPKLAIAWTESGGPPVQPRTRHGFGSRLVERGVEIELGGTAALDFAPSGLRCAIEVPMDHVA
jgi:PAS domain S-box-containing protein